LTRVLRKVQANMQQKYEVAPFFQTV